MQVGGKKVCACVTGSSEEQNHTLPCGEEDKTRRDRVEEKERED